MARTDVIVLGAGVIGTTIALQLAKRGLSVALVDRRAPGEETSYGNAGVIEGNTIFPPAFPTRLAALARVALKRATEANYHLAFLPTIAPFLYMQLLTMVGFGYAVFGDLPDVWTLAGSSVIIASGVYLLHRERQA